MRFSILAVLLLLLGSAGMAQTGKGYITIEARVGAADAVYYGTLVEVAETKEKLVPPSSADEYPLFKLKVNVQETLKGPATQELSLAVRGPYPPVEILNGWKRDATKFLWFIGKGDILVSIGHCWVLAPTPEATLDSSCGIFRMGPSIPEHKTWKDRDEQVFSMDLRVLKDPEDILKVARSFAKKHPKRVKIESFEITHSVASLCAPHGDWNTLSVPITAELEDTARRLITSPEELLKTTPRPRFAGLSFEQARAMEAASLRMSGIKMLRHFKSARNIELLKRQLKDSFSQGTWYGQNSTQKGRFGVRAAAYEVLTEWRVPVPKPVLDAGK